MRTIRPTSWRKYLCIRNDVKIARLSNSNNSYNKYDNNNTNNDDSFQQQSMRKYKNFPPITITTTTNRQLYTIKYFPHYRPSIAKGVADAATTDESGRWWWWWRYHPKWRRQKAQKLAFCWRLTRL